MKYMGWSFPELEACPADLIPVIVEMAKEERDKAEQRRAERRHGRKG
jgi:hypothetical protein